MFRAVLEKIALIAQTQGMRTSEPYKRLVGRRVKEARVAASLSQADLAERMQDLGFSSWLSQTVSSTERAARRVTAEELLGLMVACETDLTALLYPAADFQSVSLPAGQQVVLPAAKYAYNPKRHSIWDGNKSLLSRSDSEEHSYDVPAQQ
jgi:transcriptional regulator with XRE-family HTH domain